MTNLFIVTLIFWETRNWRHNKKAVEWCKNYGLVLLGKNFYMGKLKRGEQAVLRGNFERAFVRKTEKFLMFNLCKKCYYSADLPRKIKKDLVDKSFEMIG